MRVLLGVAAAALLLAGCGGSNDAGDTPPPTTPAATVQTPTAAESSIDGHEVLTTAIVLDGFKAAKLPVRNPRDNSANCEGLELGCIQLMTTDDISITTFADKAAQQKLVDTYGADAFSSGNVVLTYAAARTPAANRPKYERVLAALK